MRRETWAAVVAAALFVVSCSGGGDSSSGLPEADAAAGAGIYVLLALETTLPETGLQAGLYIGKLTAAGSTIPIVKVPEDAEGLLVENAFALWRSGAEVVEVDLLTGRRLIYRAAEEFSVVEILGISGAQ